MIPTFVRPQSVLVHSKHKIMKRILTVLFFSVLFWSCKEDAAQEDASFATDKDVPLLPFEKRMQSGLALKAIPIDSVEALNYSRAFKHFLNKKIPQGWVGKTIADKMYPGWCPNCADTSRAAFQFNVEKSAIDEIFKQPGAKYLLIFPAKKNGKLTFVLAPADGNMKRIMGNNTGRSGGRGKSVIYDDLGACPPPNNCTGFE